METEEQQDLKLQTNKEKRSRRKHNSVFELPNKYLYILIAFIVFVIILINILYFSSSKNDNTSINNPNKMRGIQDTQIFDQNTLLKYKTELNEFCNYNDKNISSNYEDQITLANVSLLSQIFKMYVYKNEDIVSKEILTVESWESEETSNLLTALLYYSALYGLKPKDIYVLDIGSNIGWYSLFIAKYGYNILSFEPSDLNNYILKKNYCLNKELNITFIKKGLYNSEKKCDFYKSKGNCGDGFVFCDKKGNLPSHLEKSEEVTLTKLENYIPFLSKHNLGLIKIDVEGAEEKVLEGGIQLLSKYHVPFIFLEFNPDSLKLHGTDPKKFLKMFHKYGYKFPSYNFFDNEFLSVDEILERTNKTYNLYIVYHRISKKYHNLNK